MEANGNHSTSSPILTECYNRGTEIIVNGHIRVLLVVTLETLLQTVAISAVHCCYQVLMGVQVSKHRGEGSRKSGEEEKWERVEQSIILACSKDYIPLP